MNGDFPKINQTLFDYWFNRSSEEVESESSAVNYSPFVLDDLNENELKKMESMVSKILTSSQIEQAMNILRGFAANATEKQEEDTKVSWNSFHLFSK